ncbi:MAG: IS66 family insertion sequence element accessory protein TnpB [Oligoflexia bacterium]|nr:IS66 family insertion sequence element accessory protein TnpB [Oligoflexia bacterium]
MLPSRRIKIFASKIPVDMRSGFDALYKRTKETIGLDPRSGHAFLFVNKNRTRVKVLFYDGTGFVLIAKRLDRGVFSKFSPYYRKNIILTQAEFSLFFEGAQINKRFIESPQQNIRTE